MLLSLLQSHCWDLWQLLLGLSWHQEKSRPLSSVLLFLSCVFDYMLFTLSMEKNSICQSSRVTFLLLFRSLWSGKHKSFHAGATLFHSQIYYYNGHMRNLLCLPRWGSILPCEMRVSPCHRSTIHRYHIRTVVWFHLVVLHTMLW